MAMARPHVATGNGHRKEKSSFVLDAEPLNRVITIRQPDPLGPAKNPKINSSTARRTAFDLNFREITPKTFQQLPSALSLCDVGVGKNAVVVPFDIINVVNRQYRGDLAI